MRDDLCRFYWARIALLEKSGLLLADWLYPDQPEIELGLKRPKNEREDRTRLRTLV